MSCSICGYSDTERNFKLEAAKIKRNMPKYMRNKINLAIKEISAVVAFVDKDIYKLVYAVWHFGCVASEKAIDDYLYYGYHRQGKGLSYLIGIIRRTSEGIEAQAKHENTLQAIPPEITE